MITFTTSWDDGDARDMRIANLLDRYGMKGTFYIARDQRNRLSPEQIRELATRHEIGAHTLSHADLPVLTTEDKRAEIEGSKRWLETVTDQEVEMFCYPYGRFDEESKRLVQEVGYLGARSSMKTLGTVPTDPYELPVTTMIYRAPYTLLTKLLLVMRTRPANSVWETRARRKLAAVTEEQGVFHLWGHSWEIDKLDLWDSLEVFFKEVSSIPEIEYRTNGALVRAMRNSTDT